VALICRDAAVCARQFTQFTRLTSDLRLRVYIL
jgi:hypothetical protein